MRKVKLFDFYKDGFTGKGNNGFIINEKYLIVIDPKIGDDRIFKIKNRTLEKEICLDEISSEFSFEFEYTYISMSQKTFEGKIKFFTDIENNFDVVQVRTFQLKHGNVFSRTFITSGFHIDEYIVIYNKEEIFLKYINQDENRKEIKMVVVEKLDDDYNIELRKGFYLGHGIRTIIHNINIPLKIIGIEIYPNLFKLEFPAHNTYYEELLEIHENEEKQLVKFIEKRINFERIFEN